LQAQFEPFLALLRQQTEALEARNSDDCQEDRFVVATPRSQWRPRQQGLAVIAG
jgi:hypothetical protein